MLEAVNPRIFYDVSLLDHFPITCDVKIARTSKESVSTRTGHLSGVHARWHCFDALAKKQYIFKIAEVLQKFKLRSILLSNSDDLEIINDFYDSILRAVKIGTVDCRFVLKKKIKHIPGWNTF